MIWRESKQNKYEKSTATSNDDDDDDNAKNEKKKEETLRYRQNRKINWNHRHIHTRRNKVHSHGSVFFLFFSRFVFFFLIIFSLVISGQHRCRVLSLSGELREHTHTGRICSVSLASTCYYYYIFFPSILVGETQNNINNQQCNSNNNRKKTVCEMESNTNSIKRNEIIIKRCNKINERTIQFDKLIPICIGRVWEG